MNSIIFTCFALLSFVYFGQTAVLHLPDSSNPAYPGKCVTDYFGPQKMIMSPGEIMTDRKRCIKMKCSESGYQMDYASCNLMNPPPGCQISSIDQSKDYPDCCPRVVCPIRDSKNPE